MSEKIDILQIIKTYLTEMGYAPHFTHYQFNNRVIDLVKKKRFPSGKWVFAFPLTIWVHEENENIICLWSSYHALQELNLHSPLLFNDLTEMVNEWYHQVEE